MAIDIKGGCALLSVFDMPTALKFYCDVLGLQVHSSSGPLPNCGWVWLKTKGGGELMLNTAYDDDQRPAAPDPRRLEVHHDVCIYFGCPDPDGAYQHLVAHGVKAKPPEVAYYGMKQLYVSDPDGYNLCFQCRA
jgi:glyoxylase I family protein